ncbi:CidA/LrgA family protein [Alloiococcus otitis]|uniref:CidA/LrgA family protein n=1 Tax=Alloiococcus otitis TaxID=1652 RepID=UPI00235638D2|nr:CidA/LrgA family protein [Alloiococcus otitis]
MNAVINREKGALYMAIFSQLFWILLFSLFGEVLSVLIAPIFPVPGSVLGLILMFTALRTGLLSRARVQEVSNWLTSNMGLFFIPPGVAIISYFDLLSTIWWQLLIVIVVTATLMMVFVGRLVQAIKHKRDHKAS